MRRLLRLAKWPAIILGVVFIAIQFVPYGRDHSNPPVTGEPQWDSAMTRRLAVKTCFSCHSNETEWPWYSNIAPMSWLVQKDVDEGRDELNFSEWDEDQDGDDSAETVVDGEMPPLRYVLAHPTARLSDEEKRALIAGLERTFGDGGSDDDDGGSDDDGDDDNSGPGS
jgi:Haem-binding domain